MNKIRVSFELGRKYSVIVTDEGDRQINKPITIDTSKDNGNEKINALIKGYKKAGQKGTIYIMEPDTRYSLRISNKDAGLTELIRVDNKTAFNMIRTNIDNFITSSVYNCNPEDVKTESTVDTSYRVFKIFRF